MEPLLYLIQERCFLTLLRRWEQALLTDELRVADLPAAWNAKYREYLGIESPTDTDGVLQDVHWSAGLIGYFPTYSLGNLYAAQFFAHAEAELGDLAPSRETDPGQRTLTAVPTRPHRDSPLEVARSTVGTMMAVSMR